MIEIKESEFLKMNNLIKCKILQLILLGKVKLVKWMKKF